MAALGQQRIEARIDLASIALENLVPFGFAKCGDLVDIALSVVEWKTILRIDTRYRTEHFGCKQYVIDRHDLGVFSESND